MTLRRGGGIRLLIFFATLVVTAGWSLSPATGATRSANPTVERATYAYDWSASPTTKLISTRTATARAERAGKARSMVVDARCLIQTCRKGRTEDQAGFGGWAYGWQGLPEECSREGVKDHGNSPGVITRIPHLLDGR